MSLFSKTTDTRTNRASRHQCIGIQCEIVIALSLSLFIFIGNVVGQPLQDIPAPPPLKVLSKSERQQLDAEPKVKDHTKLALALMDARLKAAEAENAKQEYRAMFTELGHFHALMDHTLIFLTKGQSNSGRVLSNLKRLEIGLRGFMPRLEVIRRDLPLEFEHYVRALMKLTREARTRAVEPFFADTVAPNTEQ